MPLKIRKFWVIEGLSISDPLVCPIGTAHQNQREQDNDHKWHKMTVA
jgi:hypothetical protein